MGDYKGGMGDYKGGMGVKLPALYFSEDTTKSKRSGCHALNGIRRSAIAMRLRE